METTFADLQSDLEFEPCGDPPAHSGQGRDLGGASQGAPAAPPADEECTGAP
ncbi:MAG TPA: hypothetical protein VGW34_03960 [Allosphingosinicella sp.]|nr:hypothetical protein [Allosphingosinicella sp.]